jgi:D-sedoheptulose 7-phosphate isomerase
MCDSIAATIEQVADELSKTVKSGGKIYIFGNGGSAADAQHFAAELVNRFLMERRPLPAVALTTDTSVITSISNDYSFEQIFSRQVEALGREGDALLALSTSGTSPNVMRALEKGNALSMLTVGFSGGSGGQMAPLCDICINIESGSTPRIQEAHHLALHIICELMEIKLFGDEN